MGRPKKIQPDDSKNRCRTTPEELDKLKAERLIRMKRFLRGGGKTPPASLTAKLRLAKPMTALPKAMIRRICTLTPSKQQRTISPSKLQKKLKILLRGILPSFRLFKEKLKKLASLMNTMNILRRHWLNL